MKRIVMVLVVVCGPLVLEAADTPPPGYDMVKVHPLEGKGALVPLSSSPGNSVLGALTAAASYCFSSASPAPETEKEKIAREMRDAVLGRSSSALKSLLEKYGVEYAEVEGPDKYNAFHMACYNGFLEGIDILASGKIGKKGQRKKVTIDRPNGKGKTSLQVSLMHGHVEVATKLIDLGAAVGDDEVLVVRDLRKEKGSNNDEVKALAELLSNARKKIILHTIFDTDSESAGEEEDEEDAS